MQITALKHGVTGRKRILKNSFQISLHTVQSPCWCLVFGLSHSAASCSASSSETSERTLHLWVLACRPVTPPICPLLVEPALISTPNTAAHSGSSLLKTQSGLGEAPSPTGSRPRDGMPFSRVASLLNPVKAAILPAQNQVEPPS